MNTTRLRILIALGLFAAGVVVYLWLSDAPARVLLVTVPLQLVLLVGGVALASHHGLRPLTRFFLLLAFVALFGVAWSYSTSLVVVKIEPFDLGFLLPLIVALGVELAAFAAVVWLLGARYERMFHRQRPAPR